MRYDDKYDKTEERMLDVIDCVQELSKDRFIASLYVRHVSSLDVDIRLAEVRRCLDTVHGECLRLAKLEISYNKDFAVDDNQRFTTAERLFNRLRSTMAYLRKKLRTSCPIVHKQPTNPNFKPSIFERSVLTKGCCARDLYDITSFEDNVQALYYEQQSLFANVILSLAICSRVIKEEREIRADADRCVKILEDHLERILEDIEDMVDAMSDIAECEIQKLIAEMGKEAYAQKHFHGPTMKKLKEYAVFIYQQRKLQQEQQAKNIPMLFKDPNRAADAMIVIAHFDELRPDNRRMMNAFSIRLFCNWCEGGRVDSPKEKHYQLLIRNYKGKKEEFPSWHAVTTSKKGKDMDAEQAKFNTAVEELLKKYKADAA